jgi:hypothetical protein
MTLPGFTLAPSAWLVISELTTIPVIGVEVRSPARRSAPPREICRPEADRPDVCQHIF